MSARCKARELIRGEAWWINDSGQIVDRADLPGSQVHHAFLWKNGRMIDGSAARPVGRSTQVDVNSRGQAIIDTGVCGVGGGPGLLWEDGKLYDLNALIPPSRFDNRGCEFHQ